MSADGRTVGASGAATRAARHYALRIALGATASLAIVEALNWDVTFIAPTIAAQFLIKQTPPPTLRQAIALLAIIGVTTGGMVFLSAAFIATPPVMIAVLTLVLYISFYAHARGAPEMITMMVQISAVTVPVFSVISPAAGAAFAALFTKAGFVALLVVWAAFAAFPARLAGAADAAAKPLSFDRADAARFATCNTLILLPILLWYLFDATQVAVVMLITIVMMLRQIGAATRERLAAALILANLLGGIAANVAYIVIESVDRFTIFVFVLLVASLGFAGQIARGGNRAAMLAVAFSTFILLLGIGLTPLPGGSASAFVTRIVYIVLAAAYTIGAASLFGSRILLQPQRS